MYVGKYLKRPAVTRPRVSKRTGTALLSLLFLAAFSISSTLAYLATESKPVLNEFKPSVVTCEITEDFSGTKKSNVNVVNTGDVDAYVRVQLISYRQDADGKIIGGMAVVPPFTPGEGWIQLGNHYYYKDKLAPGKSPKTPLIGAGGISLSNYAIVDNETEIVSGDITGGVQVIEVLAEAVQADGGRIDEDGNLISPALYEAWNIVIDEDGMRIAPASE